MKRFLILYALLFIHPISFIESSLILQSTTVLVPKNEPITSSPAAALQQSLISTTISYCESLYGMCYYGKYDSNCFCIPPPMCFTETGFCDNTYGNCECLSLSMGNPNPPNVMTTTVGIKKCVKRK